ncbi:MAG: hypothetical protein KDB53_12035, partial [Planctomycetes bacterium]|nr:hypothetical protein [Planctomycetota bacterium]
MQACVSLNTSTVATPNPREVRFLTTQGARGFLGESAPGPIVAQVVDLVSGLPVAGATVNVAVDMPGFRSTTTLTTDATGRVQPVRPPGTLVGTGSMTLGGSGIDPAWIPIRIYEFEVNKNLAPPVGAPFVTFRFLQASAEAMPFVLAADLPTATPTGSPYGLIHTSLLAPGPNFAALDGLGLFGSPDPTAIAAPNYFQVLTVNGPIPTGLTVVLQLYTFDPSAAFPHNIVISPPRLLSF